MLSHASCLARGLAIGLAIGFVTLPLGAREAGRPRSAASKRGVQIEKARHLPPRNPRVLLLDAVALYARPKGSAAEKDRALNRLKQATAAFEAERQETEHAPGWGAAEAY